MPTITVTGVSADDTQTVLTIEFAGEGIDGKRASPDGRPELVDATGTAHFITGARPLGAGTSEWIFPAIAATAGELRLRVEGLTFTDPPPSPGALPTGVRVGGPWDIAIEWDGRRTATERYEMVARAPYGPGMAVVEAVFVSAEGITVEGQLEGFTVEEISELVAGPATLTLADGTEIAFVSGRTGFGDMRERFSYRFAPASSVEGAVFSLPFEVSSHPQDPVAADALRARGGGPARIVIGLPR